MYLGIKLTWKNTVDFAEGVRIYRSLVPFDMNALPEPIATLPPTAENYVDESVDSGTTYYYMTSTFLGEKEVFSAYQPALKAGSTLGEIGTLVMGGIYIGNITIADGTENDGVYAVIMALSSGDSGSAIAWAKSTVSNRVTGATSMTDGAKNTYMALDTGNAYADHPAANFCTEYDGGGFNDWYLPSMNELHLAYNNRSWLSPNALANSDYWSSSESAAGSARTLRSNGSANTNSKTYTTRVRPFRRVKIS